MRTTQVTIRGKFMLLSIRIRANLFPNQTNFSAVQNFQVSFGVIPFENSSNGSVTVDLLIDQNKSVVMCLSMAKLIFQLVIAFWGTLILLVKSKHYPVLYRQRLNRVRKHVQRQTYVISHGYFRIHRRLANVRLFCLGTRKESNAKKCRPHPKPLR